MPRTIDEETGEIVEDGQASEAYRGTEAMLRTAPQWQDVKPLKEVVGERPPLFNLKEHPEFDGKALTIVRVKEVEGGELGPYVIMACWIAQSAKFDDNPQPCVIRTGSEQVMSRVIPAMATINAGQPLTTVLHAAGRAWLID